MKKLLTLIFVLIVCVACLSSCALINSIFPCKHKETVTDAAVAATCTETGLTEGSHCAKCGETIVAQQTVPALGHKEVLDEAVAPTCTEDGLTAGAHCSVCNKTVIAQEVVSATHTYGEWIDATAPDCFFEGEQMRICSVCEYVDVQHLAKLEHKFVQDEETKLYSCELCDARIYAGHLYAAFDVGVNWYDAYKTCTNLGGHLVTITSEGEQNIVTEIINSRTLPINLADYFYWAGGLKNTNGWEWITGEDFGYTHWGSQGLDNDTANWHIALTTDIRKSHNSKNGVGDWEDLPHTANWGFICEWELDIVEDEHYFTEWEVTTEATCFNDGEQYRICTYCGLEETEVLPQLEHNFVFNEATGVTSCEHCNAALYNGHIYKIFTVSLSWYDAYTYCNDLGGHLVTITSAEEQTFMETYMNSQSFSSRSWIGGYNDGTGYKWITDEEYDYKANSFSTESDEFFLEINYKGIGKWNDLYSYSRLCFICEWENE